MKTIIMMGLLICALPALASTQLSPKSSVKKIISYSELGGGDVIVQLAENGSRCHSGYWLKKTDPGFEANYKMIITAFQSNLKSVIIEGDLYKLWTGKAMGVYCHIANVQYSS